MLDLAMRAPRIPSTLTVCPRLWALILTHARGKKPFAEVGGRSKLRGVQEFGRPKRLAFRREGTGMYTLAWGFRARGSRILTRKIKYPRTVVSKKPNLSPPPPSTPPWAHAKFLYVSICPVPRPVGLEAAVTRFLLTRVVAD